ncbi:MAG: hypothetical protein CL532_01420 [Aestuariivita sp.]|nr:hypothetical protein [Aestuariivita sp.]|tara:strand:+ start:6884 stop:7696 length:813 start_codon:yes stop_codon:yes gene_type:complete
MSVTGSSLVNTSSNGQPTNNEDRPFSFALGTQIFLNPTDDPTDAVISFKANADLLAGSLASGASNLAVGLAVDSQLNSLSGWGESFISTASSNIFAVGFGRMSTAANKVGVNVAGTQVTTIGKTQEVTSISLADNALSVSGHPFNTGDRVVVKSTATVPGGLSAAVSYYVIVATADTIKLASSRVNALGGSDIDIQSSGSGTITVESDEIFTLTRAGSSGSVTLQKDGVTIATFTNTNSASPLRLFYWCREQSASNSSPIVKEIKVRGAI